MGPIGWTIAANSYKDMAGDKARYWSRKDVAFLPLTVSTGSKGGPIAGTAAAVSDMMVFDS